MNKFENGQTIVLIVIVMVGLIAIAALLVDGGNAFFNRRDAQTAADAGALAGAYEYCVNDNDPTTVITEYVEVQNHATLESWTFDGGNIVVSVSKEQTNFFAKIFGQPTTIVYADASAACFPPGAADSVLPIAWSCRAPLPGMDSDSPDCEYKAIPWKVMEQLTAPGYSGYDPYNNLLDDGNGNDPGTYHDGSGSLMIYLIMDSIPSAAEIPCIQTDPINGDVDCDLDGDGKIDIIGNGDRSWLILDGDANNAQLDDIIRGDLVFGIDNPPTWYPGRDGAIADVYKDAKAFIEGRPAMIPVFEQFCAPTSNPLTDPLCSSVVEPGDTLVQISTAASGTYFRVTSFAEFYVTCVSDKQSHPCPGKDLATSYGIITKSTPSIEGYFISGWAASDQTIGNGTNTLDLGIYVISLTD